MATGRWRTFCSDGSSSFGVRLLLAGLRQILQPRWSAETILGIEGEDVLVVVRELGFANVALGTVGVVSLLVPGWDRPAALAGAIFYALAGVNHARETDRNRHETVAMVSDLLLAVLIGVLGLAAMRP
jgi:hypothetical protein